MVEAYTIADWPGSKTDGRSTTCYCTLVGGNLVSWNSKKPVKPKSSAEVEYWGMTLGTYEFMWQKILQYELGFI